MTAANSTNDTLTYSDYLMDPDTRLLFRVLYWLGTLWRSKLRFYVSQSSTEAEQVTSTEATKEVTWLQQLMRHLKHDGPQLTSLF